MKKKHIFSSAAIVALSIFAASCSSDDTTSAYEDNNTLTTFTGSSVDCEEDPTAGSATRSSICVDQLCEEGAPDNALTRTSLTPIASDTIFSADKQLYFHWDWGDVVYVQDDKGTWNKSINPLQAKLQSADFQLYGTYLKGSSYSVRYVGINSTNPNQVIIPATQGKIVSAANSLTTHHISKYGDCAVGQLQRCRKENISLP